MEDLGKIFGSSARIKIMRLFLFNEDQGFDIGDVALRSRVTKSIARKEVNLLHKSGFLKKKTFTKEVQLKSRKKGEKFTIKKKKASGWILNREFPLVQPFKSLLVDSDLIRTHDLPRRFRGSGQVKLLVLSGIFMKDDDRKVDMLIVGDKIKKGKLERTLKEIESEIGKELRYAVFDSKEFIYRLDMYDKLLRDIFDYSHKKLIDKLKLKDI